ncbi:protein TASOR 2 isoform X3 [Ornithorhynchus anatinus]|uniref:protein TASOR 2 isoform X3 n=1 Tax=Ornithorhynchus anatinus TaxID=9258 RepID=UPI0010A873E4|nr:protein TASOR 2 isoform X3 [Ornithorhynchus anatinus]
MTITGPPRSPQGPKPGFPVFHKVATSSSPDFQTAVSVLHNSYLDSNSKHVFQYSQVTLVKNDIFLHEFETFCRQKKAKRYTEEELKEIYGFLLFDSEIQAKLVCQQGLRVGSSSITALGDPAKGVYVSKYSDYLHPRPWYHGKSGYIVIFNLVKGKVKVVPENCTPNSTSPTSGYDCHIAASINKVTTKTSHFHAFELSQYYLYEISGSRVVNRPRQIYPRVIVAFQYSEPRRMSALTHEDTNELFKVPTSPWKGQLTVESKLMCDVTLWSPHGTMIPAWLPQELDIKYVMHVSSLKKKLPEAAFRKSSYVKGRVCHEGICFSLYEMEISNKQGTRLDRLKEFIKNKKLAVIKCLEGGRFLLLLTSSALICDTDGGENGHSTLHALLLFPSSSSTCLEEENELTCEDEEEGISRRVMPILPALQYALLVAKKPSVEEGIQLNTAVKHHFHEFTKLERSSSMASQDIIDDQLFLSFETLPSELELTLTSEKYPLPSIAHLQSYFSAPDSYTLEVSHALECLSGRSPTPCLISDEICDTGFSRFMPLDAELPESRVEGRNETETSKQAEDTDPASEPNLGQSNPAANLRSHQKKRKAGGSIETDAEKNWGPLRVLNSRDRNENQERNQNARVNLCCPFPKKLRSKAKDIPSSETTLKLAKGQFPQKRKRGAEVLTAQFVQTTKSVLNSQKTPVWEDVPEEAKNKKLKKQETTVTKVVTVTKRVVKRPSQKQRGHMLKSKQNPRSRKHPDSAKGETHSQLPTETSSKGRGTAVATQIDTTDAAPDDLQAKPSGRCDSLALNMLADLALSSATSSAHLSFPRDPPAPSDLPQNNESSLSTENSPQGTSDHEYHSLARSQSGGPASDTTPKASSDDSSSDVAVSQREKCLGPSSSTSADSPTVLPQETHEARGTNTTSFISAEHSYASLTAEQFKKHPPQKGSQVPAFAKNGAKGPEAGTPVGKVMPFRHQQNSPVQKLLEDTLVKPKSSPLSPCSKEDFGHSHTVSSCNGSFKITCKWEAEYVFSLDSKYTNNPLEKTIIRALHGPWDSDMPDNVEEVKLILHMWVALFYSNQNKVLSSSRKVVEHSNPVKYVSINSTMDSFEFSEISEESLGEEGHPGSPGLEEDQPSRNSLSKISFPCTNSLLSSSMPASSSGLESCTLDEWEDPFSEEDPPGVRECQDDAVSCSNEINGKRMEEEPHGRPEDSTSMLSGEYCNPHIQAEDEKNESYQKPEASNVAFAKVDISQTLSTKTPQDKMISDQSVASTLKTKKGLLSKVGACENSAEERGPRRKVAECQEAEKIPGERSPCTSITKNVDSQTDVAPVSGTEFIRKVSSVPSRETTQARLHEDYRDTSSAYRREPADDKHLCNSSEEKGKLGKENYSPQKRFTVSISETPTGSTLIEAITSPTALPACQALSDDMKAKEGFLLIQGLQSVSSSQVQPAAITTSVDRETDSARCMFPIPSLPIPLEKEREEGDLRCESMHFESASLAFAKGACIPMDREEAIEFSESDSEISAIELTLTISPPSSPMRARNDPLEDLEFQDNSEEPLELPSTNYTGTSPEDKEINTNDCISLCLKELLEPQKSQESQYFDLLSDRLGNREEAKMILKSPLGASTEAESPASSSKDPSGETPPPQHMVPRILDLHNQGFEEVPESSLMGSAHPPTGASLENDTTTQEKQAESSTEVTTSSTEVTTSLNSPQEKKESPVLPPEERDWEGNSPVGQSNGLGKPNNPEVALEELTKPEDSWPPDSKAKKVLGQESLSLKCVISETSEPPYKHNERKRERFLCVPALLSSTLSQPQDSPRNSEVDFQGSVLGLREHGQWQGQSLNSDGVSQNPFLEARPHLESSKCASEGHISPTRDTGRGHEEAQFQEGETPAFQKAKSLQSTTSPAGDPDEAPPDSASATTSVAEANGRKTLQSQKRPEHEKKDGDSGHRPTDSPSAALGTPPDREAEMAEEVSGRGLPTSSVPKALGSSACRDHVAHGCPVRQPEAEPAANPLGRDGAPNWNSSFYSTPLSTKAPGQESFGGAKKQHKLSSEEFGVLRTRKRAEAAAANYDSPVNADRSDREGWDYASKAPGLEAGAQQGSCIPTPREKERSVPFLVNIRDQHGISRAYANFTITKKVKDNTRTLQVLKKPPSVPAESGLISSWPGTISQSPDSLTQNTLDLEYLRFSYKLKQMMKNPKSSLPPSLHFPPAESPTPSGVETFPLTKEPEAPSLQHPVYRSRSPLKVTIASSESQRGAAGWSPRKQHDDLRSRSDRPSKNLPRSGRGPSHPAHLRKLRYDGKLKESWNGISLILSEFTEFSKVIMNSNQQILQENSVNVAPGEAAAQKTVLLVCPRRPVSFENLITDLCTNLRNKLGSVMREVCKSSFMFYLIETETDGSFFLKAKNFLKKAGHVEIEPLHFCQMLHRDSSSSPLVVFIRNEDIATHVHQIPCLLKLKRCPGVIFAGVDSPEDVLGSTYQELFCAGGFVVSDNKVLEAMTLVELKDVIRVMERLNENGRWQWLLHYQESKKLREGNRMDSIAHKKNSILKSCLGTNMIEVLHYHQCDMHSASKSDTLKCLLGLQVQRVAARFAVYLTEKLTAATESFESSGILVTDVTTFVATLPQAAAPFKSSYW